MYKSLKPKRILIAMAVAGLAAPALVHADLVLPSVDQPSYNQGTTSGQTSGTTSSQTTGTTGTGAGTTGPVLDSTNSADGTGGMGDSSGVGTSGSGTQSSDQMSTDDVPSSKHQREAVDQVEQRRSEGMGAPGMEGTHGGADYNGEYQSDLQTGPGAPQTEGYERRSTDTPERVRQHDTPGTNSGAIGR